MINLNLPPMDTYWVDPSHREYFIVHWGDGFTPTTVAAEANTVRAYDDYHRNTQGWGGIGYNLCVGPATGEVYLGRGLNAVGAHSPNRNYNGIGVCVLGSPTVVTDAIKRGLREAYRIACEHTGKKLIINVHRNSPGNYTDCPGDALADWVMHGGITASETSQKTPTKRKGKQKMLLIHLKDYATGSWRPGSGHLFAIVGEGFFFRFTDQAVADRFARQLGNSVEVTNAIWDGLSQAARTGSNSPAYRDKTDENIEKIAAGIEKIAGDDTNG